MNQKYKNFIKTLGPGIMFAGTCIGGSHLVQSTRAGADYGFQLIGLVIIANFFKYPFFVFASRYTNATGDNILQGYKKIGKWPLYIYGFITLISMFIVTGAIFMVTGGLLGNLFNSQENIMLWVSLIAIIVTILLLIGKFSILDQSIKIIGIVLVLSVVIATIFVLVNGANPHVKDFELPQAFSNAGFPFIIALMGWMPMGIDMSAWHSIWTQERIKQTHYHPTLKETLLDFNIGYGITVFLAFCFLTLGAYIFYGSGEVISNSAIIFSDQLVSMFTKSIGSWSYIIIAAATFSTMFGTSLTLVDGYSKSSSITLSLLLNKRNNSSQDKLWVILTIIGGLTIVYLSTSISPTTERPYLNFKKLMDLATTISFLIAPFAALLNHLIIFNKKFPQTHKPSKRLKTLSISGIIFLSIISLIYALSLFSFFTN